MANLTSEQINQLATHFMEVAQEVGNYRQQQYDMLNEPERQKLKELQTKILDYSNSLYTLSATLVMYDVQSSLESINLITVDIKNSYKTLLDVQKAINVAASVVNLGAAIISQNPKTIIDSAGGLAETWNN